MKVALVHEFLNQLGGAEKVLQNFLEIWPEAEIHTLLYNPQKTLGQFESYKKHISWLNKLPSVNDHPRIYLPLMPAGIESFDFSGFDVVISDSSSFAHGAIAKDKLHICYCHTPARFLWTNPEYLGQQKYNRVLKWLGSRYLPMLKAWDLKASKRPNFYIANSRNVASRIKEFYNRESIVIPPPVDTEFYKPSGERRDYFLTVTRLEPYKKVDVIIEAFNRTGQKLKIAGTGTQLETLKQLAKPNIEFLGRVTDEELRNLYSGAQAFVFAAEEDAGIVLVEAQACGTPVIAYRAGGATEVVTEGVTGEFFPAQTAESLIAVLKNYQIGKYSATAVRANAEKYSKKSFQDQIKKFVEQKYQETPSSVLPWEKREVLI